MRLNNRQLDRLSTPGFNMSNTSGAPPPASETEPSVPSQPSSQVPPPPAESSAAPPPAPSSEDPSSEPPASSSTRPPAPPPAPSTSSAPPPPAQQTSSEAPDEETSSSAPPPASTTLSTVPTSSSEPPSTSEQTSAEETSEPASSVVTITSSSDGKTSVIVVTSTRRSELPSTTGQTTETTQAAPIDPSSSGKGGLDKGATVAIGVVVPIVAIAILAIVGLLWWKKRRARMLAEEERRKEVEDYSYNPNADPTIPSVAMMSDNGYEMREDGSSGYRGWGNTVAGSTGRKASTTISNGVPYSDATSPTYANASEARSGEPLMDSPHSGEGEILGAMGPSAANNRGGDVHRGPSNASSSYSAAGRSDGSDGPIGVAYGSGAGYYDSYSQNPYSDNPYGGSRPQEAGGAPIIRDNPARRNTRIESPSHYPQGSVGISQNF